MEDLSLDNWKQIQTKTFTKWVNSKLKKGGFTEIQSLFNDLSSGVSLANLLSSLGKAVPKHNSSPNSRIKKIENLHIILDFVRSQNIALVNIGPEDIVDGDQKLILGLVWTLISKMSISEAVTNEMLSLRDQILAWTQRVTACYEHVKINNLTTDWQDGIGFNAIVHRFMPELVPDFYLLKKTDAMKNCESIFKIAEHSLDIPRLFDPEDIIEVVKPDEKSILTYLLQFYVKFTSEEAIVNAKNSLTYAFKGVNHAYEARNAYEHQARQLVTKRKLLTEKINQLNEMAMSIKKEIEEVEIKNTELIGDSIYLASLLERIKMTHKTFNLREYHPPTELNIEKIAVIKYHQVNEIIKVDELVRSLNKLEDSEAKQLEEIANVSVGIFRDPASGKTFSEPASVDITNIIKKLKLNIVNMQSEIKNKEYNKMKQLLNEKAERLSMCAELEENVNKLTEQASRLFIAKDNNKTGFISKKEALLILKTLKQDISKVPDMYCNDKMTKEDLVQLIKKLNSTELSKDQIQTAFQSLSKDLIVNVHDMLPGVVLKGLSVCISEDNTVEYNKFMELFN